MKNPKKAEVLIEDEILDKALSYNYTKELEKVHDHIAHLRLVAVSYKNMLKDKDMEIERLNTIIRKIENFLSLALEIYDNVDLPTLTLVKNKIIEIKKELNNEQ